MLRRRESGFSVLFVVGARLRVAKVNRALLCIGFMGIPLAADR